MRIKIINLALQVGLIGSVVYGQGEPLVLPKKTYTPTVIPTAQSPTVDGKLNEGIWQLGEWQGQFVQREPEENQAPTGQTQFQILYDARHLYIGIQCLDPNPKAINSRKSARDGLEGDWIQVLFDSYHDQRSAFSFTLTAAGDKGDRTLAMDGQEEDPSWNPTWDGKSQIDSLGWTAEIKIPLNQLRFSDQEMQVWGFQMVRRIFRKAELSVWQRVPLDAPTWVGAFGELHDLQPRLQRQVELQPFITSALKTQGGQQIHPNGAPVAHTFSAGLDGKIGITNHVTLDFTVNPDFGQVEADPAAIALDGFQLFFEERRPFFIENKQLFNYQFSNPQMGGTFSSDNLFYSRRIGRNPQGSVQTKPGEYSKVPDNTTILGALKLSGKTQKGLSFGVMESLTSNEYAAISHGEENRRVRVEPLTNYFVARVQQDFNNRNSYIGGILTSTHRDLSSDFQFLHRSAVTGGLDFRHQWNERNWYLQGSLVMSQVQGSQAALYRTQTSIAHLFQRPDAQHLQLDSTRTSLSGTGGDIRLGKAGKGHFTLETGLTWRSPGLELNDLGFMRNADEIQDYLRVSYRSLQPFGAFRQGSIVYQHWLILDFAGQLNYIDWDVEFNGTFQNNWSATFGLFSQPHIYSKALLMGGPRVFLPDQYGAWWALGSDPRKKLFFGLNGWTKTGGEGSYKLLDSGLQLTYQPIDQFSASLQPRFTLIRGRLQYTDQAVYQNSTRYILSELNQNTFSLALRLNYTFHADLSLQYYGEAFLTKGQYENFNYLLDPLAKNRTEQLHFFPDEQIQGTPAGQNYVVDENLDQQVDYSFRNPDFSFAQFRSNLVLRYEYLPGSTLFFVWAQGANSYEQISFAERRRFGQEIFGLSFGNTFLVKTTYRFAR